MSEKDVFTAMLERAENKTKEVKPTWEKRLSEESAKELAKKYNLGRYEGYYMRDGYYCFENGRVGDCTPERTEVDIFGKDYYDRKSYDIDLNDKSLKFVKHTK